ncbi:hypothetical protein ABPG72_017642 [Tetrahymena utriculariae]
MKLSQKKRIQFNQKNNILLSRLNLIQQLLIAISYTGANCDKLEGQGSYFSKVCFKNQLTRFLKSIQLQLKKTRRELYQVITLVVSHQNKRIIRRVKIIKLRNRVPNTLECLQPIGSMINRIYESMQKEVFLKFKFLVENEDEKRLEMLCELTQDYCITHLQSFFNKNFNQKGINKDQANKYLYIYNNNSSEYNLYEFIQISSY